MEKALARMFFNLPHRGQLTALSTFAGVVLRDVVSWTWAERFILTLMDSAARHRDRQIIDTAFPAQSPLYGCTRGVSPPFPLSRLASALLVNPTLPPSLRGGPS